MSGPCRLWLGRLLVALLVALAVSLCGLILLEPLFAAFIVYF